MGWKSKVLSYVGRLSLIKHTLLSIPIYSTLVFKLPTSVANKIDSLCRGFLWSGEESKKKFALMAWKTICRDKKEGGLGISHVTIVSEALRGKMAWRLATEENKQWIDVCRRKYLQKDNPFLRVEKLPYGYPFWNGLVLVQKKINRCITWRIGNGKDTYFWEDTWLREQPLAKYEEFKKIVKWAMRK